MLPREKALNYGIGSLTNSELLALVIKSGNKDNTVFNIVDNLLDKANGFSNLLSLTYEELIEVKGINQAKALELLAILEIAKRLSVVSTIKEDDLLSPSKIIEWLKFNVGFSNVEQFMVLYLNRNGKIIKSEVLFKGTKDQSLIGVDEILRKAILLKTSAIVICHNHPSGSVLPSTSDKVTTENIKKACEMMSIRLLDHIIISQSSYYSFKQAGLLC